MDETDTNLNEQQRKLLELTENEMNMSSRLKLRQLLEEDQAIRDDYAAIHAIKLLNAERLIETEADAFERRIEHRIAQIGVSKSPVAADKGETSTQSLIEKLFRGLTGSQWMVALQAVVIVVLGMELLIPSYQSENFRGQNVADCYPYVVQFKADAPFGDIQRVLVQADMKISKGPSPAGEYELSAPGKTLEQVKNVLTDVVQAVGVNQRCER